MSACEPTVRPLEEEMMMRTCFGSSTEGTDHHSCCTNAHKHNGCLLQTCGRATTGNGGQLMIKYGQNRCEARPSGDKGNNKAGVTDLVRLCSLTHRYNQNQSDSKTALSGNSLGTLDWCHHMGSTTMCAAPQYALTREPGLQPTVRAVPTLQNSTGLATCASPM